MNRIVQIKIFNDILDQMFDFLEKHFPYQKSDIVLTRTSVEFIRKSNPRLVVQHFMTLVLPYKKHVFECDETFFLNFEDNVQSSLLTSKNVLLGMKIKNVWLSPDTSDRKKAYIWLYFQKLIKAGELVIN